MAENTKPEILTNNRDRGGYLIRVHEGIIGKRINEKRHEDSKKIDAYKNGILPFQYFDAEKNLKEATQCMSGPFHIGDTKVMPGTGKWCATKLDSDGIMVEWGYCINREFEIKSVEEAAERIKNLQELNRTINYIRGYLKTYITDYELRTSVIKNEDIKELLRNKNILPNVQEYEIGATIKVNDTTYTLTEDIELGRYWKPDEIIVKKRRLVIKPAKKKYGTNKDQRYNLIHSYRGIILEDVNRVKRGPNRVEKIKECIKKFDYINKKGERVKTSDTCVNRDLTVNGVFIGPDGGEWCATEVDDTGLMKEWGYCIDTGEKIKIDKTPIWEKLCNAIQYEQWSNVSELSKQLLLSGYSEITIFSTLKQNCNKKYLNPHFEQIKRLINTEYVKLYPWVLKKSAKPNLTLLGIKENVSEIVLNKLEYLEKLYGKAINNDLISLEGEWLLHYYFLVERLIILSIISKTGEFKNDILEKIKKTRDIEKLNIILIELELSIKKKIKKYIDSIDKSGNANVDFNITPTNLNNDIHKDIFFVNLSSLFGSIHKDERVLYYDKLDIDANIVEQLVFYNKSFIEPREIVDGEESEEIEEEEVKEVGDVKWIDSKKDYYSNYPEFNDPQFFTKLQKKKEFKMNKMTSWADKTIEELCRVDTFEISTQQQWIANYFNPDTPYKGLLIYWGTGVGKTCASITIAERHLDFYKKYNKKILVILGTSTLENYKKELYNFKKEAIEIKKGLIPGSLQCTKDRYWLPIEATDPASMKRREAKILKRIEQDYEFITYGSLKGIISRLLIKRGLKLDLDDDRKAAPKKAPEEEDEEMKVGSLTFKATATAKGLVWKKVDVLDQAREERIRAAISEYFSNRLIIIDEIQNIRTAGEGGDQIAPQMLEKVIHYSSDTKLVMMSATPMFNNATEIVYILNLLLENDKRDKVKSSDLFDSKDNLIDSDLLEEVSKGYISYVRGANPVSFPRKLLPNESPIRFIKENNEVYFPRPENKMNGEELEEDEAIRYNPLVKCTMSTLQESVFKKAILGQIGEEEQEDVANETFDINGKMISNLVYPTKSLLSKIDITTLFGETGFDRCFNEQNNKYSYNEETAIVKNDEDEKVPFLDQTVIQRYSPKFKKIFDNIMNTEKGIIFIYSEYKKGGSLPLALMLEQNGFEQLVVDKSAGGTVVKNRLNSDKKRKPMAQKWRYVMLDGELEAKKRARIVEKCNSEENKNGELVKVIIGTRVAGEGVDFARIRQIHILNPWDNFSRIDQVIGRGIRNCSHKDLPKSERNVTVFLYSSHMRDNSRETTDEKIHRRAERKDIQMKEVEFVLRNNAVDCASNYLANKYTIEEFGEEIGDKDGTRECGYKNCGEVYQCKEAGRISKSTGIDIDTYNIELHANREVNNYKKYIKEMFELSVIYKLKHIKSYLESKIDDFEEAIFFVALDKMISDKEKLHDKYQRIGRIVFKNGYYLFQPSDLDRTDVLPEYYRGNPLTMKPEMAEVSFKEASIGEGRIKRWLKEVKKELDTMDDEDEISYYLDRVKDVVMKKLLLEWFIGEYETEKAEDESRQDKIRNYLDEKDILIMDEDGDYPKAIHWTKQLSFEYIPDTMKLKEYTDGELYKKEMITYNFDDYPLDKHVIGRLEKQNDGKDDSPLKQMVFKIIDFSFVENKANLKLDGKACMSYNKGPMGKLLKNLGIEPETSEKRENLCNLIELSLRKYNREKKEGRVWWIESNKFYRLEKIL